MSAHPHSIKRTRALTCRGRISITNMDEEFYIPSRAVAAATVQGRTSSSPPPYNYRHQLPQSGRGHDRDRDGHRDRDERRDRDRRGDPNAIMRRSVFLCNIPIGCDDEDVYTHFDKRGFRPRCIRIRKRADGLNEGHGHIEFGSSEEAMDAIRDVNETMIFPRDRGLYPRSILVKVPRCIERELRQRDQDVHPDPPPHVPTQHTPDTQSTPSYYPETPRDPRNPRRGERPIPHWMLQPDPEPHPEPHPEVETESLPVQIRQVNHDSSGSSASLGQRTALEQLHDMLQSEPARRELS